MMLINGPQPPYGAQGRKIRRHVPMNSFFSRHHETGLKKGPEIYMIRLRHKGHLAFVNGHISSGHNSTVECQLPKLGVAGSNPVARSMGTVSGPSPSFLTLFSRLHADIMDLVKIIHKF